jgi:hypothetical protein
MQPNYNNRFIISAIIIMNCNIFIYQIDTKDEEYFMEIFYTLLDRLKTIRGEIEPEINEDDIVCDLDRCTSEEIKTITELLSDCQKSFDHYGEDVCVGMNVRF